MNVSLTPELEQIVIKRVRSGLFASASEVIREALRLLEEKDRLDLLRREVRLGLEQLDQGRHREFDHQVVKRIKREGRKRIASTKQRKG
jgi:antitoxin ParD1/3/4